MSGNTMTLQYTGQPLTRADLAHLTPGRSVLLVADDRQYPYTVQPFPFERGQLVTVHVRDTISVWIEGDTGQRRPARFIYIGERDDNGTIRGTWRSNPVGDMRVLYTTRSDGKPVPGSQCPATALLWYISDGVGGRITGFIPASDTERATFPTDTIRVTMRTEPDLPMFKSEPTPLTEAQICDKLHDWYVEGIRAYERGDAPPVPSGDNVQQMLKSWGYAHIAAHQSSTRNRK